MVTTYESYDTLIYFKQLKCLKTFDYIFVPRLKFCWSSLKQLLFKLL